MAFAKINGLDLYYETHGEGEALVLISGFSNDHTLWLNIVESLAKQYKVVILDNRGAGKTTVAPGPYSIEQMAKDVIALCDHLNIDSAYFCGNSMGGYITQALLHLFPHRVKKAIISNSSLSISTPFRYFMEGKYQLLSTQADFEGLEKISYAFCYSYEFLSRPGKIQELIDFSKNHPNPFTLKGFEAQAQAVVTFDATLWAPKFNTPTLVVGSTDDCIFNERLIRDIADTIPNAEYYCFEQTGHLPSVEHPEKFIEVINRFIQKPFSK